MTLPAFPLLWAFWACAVFPAAITLLSHRPLKIDPPGRRFYASWMLLMLGWGAACFTETQTGAGQAGTAEDYAAAIMLFASAILCSFMLWSVLCWGVTLNMLLHLVKCGRVSSLDDWEIGYAGTGGLTRLIVDRAELLFRFRLARPDKRRNTLTLTPAGQLVARLTIFASRLFFIET